MLKTPTHELVGGMIGLVSGWVIALIISIPLLRIPYVGDYLPIILGVILGYFGLMVGLRKTDDLPEVFLRSDRGGGRTRAAALEISPKILDTSVIIDGRIADITKSGFLEGELIVPGFVLEELQFRMCQRNRGRRGWISSTKSKEPYTSVRIVEQDTAILTRWIQSSSMAKVWAAKSSPMITT